MTGLIDQYDERLALVGSENRAAVLVEILQGEPDPAVKRELLREWFNICDALAPWRDELREQFQLAGWVSDTDERPALPATVYRGSWHDDEAELALSWTLDRAVAERFCKYLTGLRAEFLGIRRHDAIPYVWRATCTEAYGYLNDRQEQELIAARLEDVEAISQLVTGGGEQDA